MNTATDNFKDFPARMSDGRAFTDYTPNCLTNNKKISTISDSYEYRQNLINNGDKLLQNGKMLNAQYLCDTCNKAIVPDEMFVQSCGSGKLFYR